MGRPPNSRPILVQPEDESIKLIPLTRGKIAIIDADKYKWAAQWNWYAVYDLRPKAFYAARGGRSGEPQTVYLHRQICGEPHSQVDHANGNSLDCRRSNLRLCTPSQNNANQRPRSDNRSGCPGVRWRKDRNKWTAVIGITGQHKHLGTFAAMEDAIAARLAAERQYFGEFAFSARRAG